MKYRILPVALAVMLLSACSAQTPVSTDTGYPDGQVQREMLYYSGSLWERDFYGDDIYESSRTLDTLPATYALVGEVASENSYNIPSSELQSAHIEAGTKVYASEENLEYIYIECDDNYYRFVIIE